MRDHNPVGRNSWTPSSVSALLCGVSVLALLLNAGPAEAGRFPAVGRIAPTQAAQQAASQAAQQAAAAAQQSQVSLGRAAAALAIMQQVQKAAGALAGQGTVPDGINSRGLMPQGGTTATSCGLFCTNYQLNTTDPTLWQGASAPQQTVQGNQYTINIKQTQQKAILNWDSFSIGRNTSLNFIQQSSDWIAFNWSTKRPSPPARFWAISARLAPST